MKQSLWQIIIILLITCLIACKKEAPAPQSNIQVEAPVEIEAETKINKHQASALTKALWKLGGTQLDRARKESQVLNAAIGDLLKQPEEEKMKLAKQRWLSTMQAFEKFFVFLQLARVHPEQFGMLQAYHSSIATWPIQPGYLDAFGIYQYSGIVFDIQLPINESSLRNQHGMTDLNEVTLGLYALEFILAGETHQRSALSFLPLKSLSQEDKENGYSKLSELPRNRRRELLQVQARLLAKDIEGLHHSWTSGAADALRFKVTEFNPKEQVQAFIQSAVYAVLDQIKTISELTRQSKSHHSANNFKLTSIQQAQRLQYQLKGLLDFSEVIASEFAMDDNKQLIQAALISLDKVMQSSATRKDKNPEISWKETYNHLKQLAEAMLGTKSPNPSAHPTESSEPAEQKSDKNPVSGTSTKTAKS